MACLQFLSPAALASPDFPVFQRALEKALGLAAIVLTEPFGSIGCD